MAHHVHKIQTLTTHILTLAVILALRALQPKYPPNSDLRALSRFPMLLGQSRVSLQAVGRLGEASQRLEAGEASVVP